MSTGKTYSTKYLLDSNNNRGAEGQVLSTTSTGIDWVDANTVPGTGLWLTNGNDIYNSNSGSVGIGVTSLSDWGWIIDHALQFANGAFVAGRTDSTAAINLGSNAFVTATGGNAWKYFAAGAATRYIQQVGEHYFQTAGVGAAAGDTITWSTALNIANNGNAIFSASTSIGTTVAPTRTLDVRGTGMSIFGTGGYTELMLRGQVEGTGTVRNLGSWHWSVRSDVGGDNDDLKLLRFETGTFRGTSMQISNSTGNIGIGVNATPDANYRLTLEDTNEDILRLHNSTDGLDALISFTNPGGTLGRIQGIDNGGLGFDTGNNAGGINTNAMFINNSGNVGIGTTSPGAKLDVSDGTIYSIKLSNTAAYDSGINNGIVFNGKYTSGGSVTDMASVRGGKENTTDGNFGGKLTFHTRQNNGVDTERIRIDSVGNVGIGDTPSFKLDVNVTSSRARFKATTGNADIELSSIAGHDWLIRSLSDDSFAIYDEDAATERMRIDSSGLVGINVTSPQTRLQTNLGITGAYLGYLNGTTSTFDMSANVAVVHNSPAIGNGTGAGLVLANNDKSNGAPSPIIAFSAKSASNSYNHTYAAIYGVRTATGADTNWTKGDIVLATSESTGPIERMRITSAGELQVTGNGVIKNEHSSANYSYWQQTGSDARLFTQYAQPLYFGTNASTKMTILSGGNVGIGTTSPTQSKLVISGGATGTVGGGDAGITMINKFDNPDNSWSILPVITGVSNTGFSIRDNTDSADRLVIDGSGNVGIGTTTMNQFVNITSDSNTTTLMQLRTADGSEIMNFGIGSDIGYLYMESNTDMTFGTNGGEKMRITSGGNVGIGEDNPTSLLHLYKASGDPMINIQAVSAGDPGITFTSINNRTGNIFYSDGTTNAKLTYDHADTSFKLYAHNTSVADFVLNETTSYFPTQNVGIGVTSPNQKLHVNDGGVRVEKNATGLGGFITIGNATETAGNYSAYFFGNTPSDTDYFKGGIAYETLSATFGRGDMHFLQNDSNDATSATISDSVMTILNGGNVGIGTTSPNAPLQFSNAITTRKVVLYEMANNNNQFYGFGVEAARLVYSTANTGDDHVFYAGASSTSRNELIRIDGSNGDIKLSPSSRIILDDTPTASTASGSGTIVKWSVSDTTTAGTLYTVKTNGLWTPVDADNEATSIGMLAIALGSNATDGMLLQGFFYKASHGFTIGLPLYISNTAGAFSTTRPTGTNDYVRIIGYATSTNYIYFDPDKTWVQVA